MVLPFRFPARLAVLAFGLALATPAWANPTAFGGKTSEEGGFFLRAGYPSLDVGFRPKKGEERDTTIYATLEYARGNLGGGLSLEWRNRLMDDGLLALSVNMALPISVAETGYGGVQAEVGLVRPGVGLTYTFEKLPALQLNAEARLDPVVQLIVAGDDVYLNAFIRSALGGGAEYAIADRFLLGVWVEGGPSWQVPLALLLDSANTADALAYSVAAPAHFSTATTLTVKL